MLANKFDGDCFALVGAHQHGITIHNQDLMRERESGVISFIIYYYGGGEELCLGGGTFIMLPLPFCIKPEKLIAVDNLKYCFALVGAHQHVITMHNKGLM